MERPVLSMHIFPSSLIASDRHLYDTMTFFAYSSQSEDLYLYHVSVPTAYADEDTLAASVINPTYVLRRFVLESALRRMIMSSGIIDAKAVTAGDLSQPIHWARHEVKLKSVQRLEHIGSNEDSIRDVGELWWLLSLSNNEGVILKPLLDQA
ncbi:hypothetical protein EON63_01090 [archaeon]|nr:MAG: hypothetical protein EON63_01090 [archaeon]